MKINLSTCVFLACCCIIFIENNNANFSKTNGENIIYI